MWKRFAIYLVAQILTFALIVNYNIENDKVKNQTYAISAARRASNKATREARHKQCLAQIDKGFYDCAQRNR